MIATLTMAQVLQRFLPAYKARYRLSPEQSKAIGSIMCCRTEALGGCVLRCDHCDYRRNQYHSCRNRHCPQCQYQATNTWRQKQCESILPVPYFHLVFTLPHTLNGWAQLHPKIIYALLFKAAWATLKAFGDNPKQLHGQLGMSAVLHTWSQNLGRHMHLHCLVPGGALAADESRWHTTTTPYLFPVRALSRKFRGKMVSLLRQAWEAEELSRLESKAHVDTVLDQLMSKPWVVFTRHTGTQAEAVVEYLSRYTYRIAISEQRLLAMDKYSVSFLWKDYASKGAKKAMTLDGVEFIRRFLMHILPTGFMRVRHYGFLANCHRGVKCALIRRLQGEIPPCADADKCCEITSEAQAVQRLYCCPKCRQGYMRAITPLQPDHRRR